MHPASLPWILAALLARSAACFFFWWSHTAVHLQALILFTSLLCVINYDLVTTRHPEQSPNRNTKVHRKPCSTPRLRLTQRMIWRSPRSALPLCGTFATTLAGWAKIKFQLFLGFEGKSRMGIHSIIILFPPSSLQLALNVAFRWCLHHAGVGAGVGAAYVTCVPIMLRLWVGLIGVGGFN